MDWSKYPIEKLVFFVAGVIPGFVALVIFEVASPGSLGWFFALGFLGYRTRLSLIILAFFVLGNSMTTFLRGLLGAIGGAWGSVTEQQPYRPTTSYRVAPWRDPRWRSLVARHLGSRSPSDIALLSPDVFEARRKMVELLPPQERPRAMYELNAERIRTESDDLEWAQWYDHYHRIVLEPRDRDLFFEVGWGLRINLETAALYLLLSATFVPRLRHWWCILPSLLWVLVLAAEEYDSARKFSDKWATLSEQIKYFAEKQPIA